MFLASHSDARDSGGIAAAQTPPAQRRAEPQGAWCDDWEQASHGGELAAGITSGVVTYGDVTELGAVLTGAAEGRRSADDVTLFDSTGLAIQDLAIAKAALAKIDELDVPLIDV